MGGGFSFVYCIGFGLGPVLAGFPVVVDGVNRPPPAVGVVVGCVAG